MSEISMAFRKKIGEELKFIAGKISEDTTEREKSYYLSGVASLMNRIFNLEFSKYISPQWPSDT